MLSRRGRQTRVQRQFARGVYHWMCLVELCCAWLHCAYTHEAMVVATTVEICRWSAPMPVGNVRRPVSRHRAVPSAPQRQACPVGQGRQGKGLSAAMWCNAQSASSPRGMQVRLHTSLRMLCACAASASGSASVAALLAVPGTELSVSNQCPFLDPPRSPAMNRPQQQKPQQQSLHSLPNHAGCAPLAR